MAHCCRTWVGSSLRIAVTKRTAKNIGERRLECHEPSRFPILANETRSLMRMN